MLCRLALHVPESPLQSLMLKRADAQQELLDLQRCGVLRIVVEDVHGRFLRIVIHRELHVILAATPIGDHTAIWTLSVAVSFFRRSRRRRAGSRRDESIRR